MEIKTNVVNQIKLLKMSTFKNPFTFIDENVQNAQRAGATKVEIWNRANEIIIYNDGEVLDDLQKLFSISESGWNDEVTKNENPFGIGFFSNIAVSDVIEIATGFKRCTLDINKVINENNLTIVEEESREFVDGFKLTLKNTDVDRWDFNAFVKELGSHMSDVEIWLDNEYVPYTASTTYTGERPFYTNIDNKFCVGFIAFKDFWSPEKLNVYYKGRLVKALDYPFTDFSGDLYLKDGALDLIAPDRKDFIQNTKFINFKAMLEEEIKKVALANVGNEESCLYEYGFLRFASSEELANNIKFNSFDCGKEKEFLTLTSLISKDSTDELVEDVETFDSYETSKTSQIDLGSPSDDYCCVPYEIPTEESNFEYLKSVPTFYVQEDELSLYPKLLKVCKDFDITVVVADNSLVEKICKDVFNHIEDLKTSFATYYSLESVKLSPTEKRVNDLLFFLSTKLGCEKNIFKIGNLKAVEKFGRGEGAVERVKKGVEIVYDAENELVMLDKTFISKDLFKDFSKTVNKDDLKFVLKILPHILQYLADYFGTTENGVLLKLSENL